MAAGAPRKWKSVKAMQEAIDAYFKKCEGEPLIVDGSVAVDKYGVPIIINVKPPTVTGLALALGFTGRQALLDYQARPEFADTVTRAKSRCEEYAEARLYDKDGANGAKFSLGCNFGWREATEMKISAEPVKVIIDV
nr:MAG TPA: DNA packaging protein gp3 [Bacteriophage sp.]